MAFRIGIDIGGTFTDFALIDDHTGAISIHKQLTTPKDPSVAVLEGIDAILAERKASITDVSSVIHGSTLVTNALIERRGAPVGMLVTKGFRDVLDIALETRYDLYDLRIQLPRPLVPRNMRVEIDERVAADGSVRRELDLQAVDAAVGQLVDAGATALAVCFMHAFTNPAHEQAAAQLIKERYPELHVSSSADIFPFMREYERWTTTTMNAYTQPLVDLYLSRIEQGLAARGCTGPLHIMTSSGGIIAADIARRYPVRLLESGPAAGVLMSSFHGRALGADRILAYDMGGTTAKGAIVRDGVPLKKYQIEVARVHEFKQGSGLPAKIPVLNMIEIGSGGGGIATLDARGVIRVGPQSAGADPGPACYGRGGTSPTLSDANLILGYYDADHFLGGKMKLDRPAAEAVVAKNIAEPLGLDLVRAAFGIHEMVNEDVARAFRVHASEQGFDYRSACMIAFGGSGPAHAARIARKLRLPRVVFPRASGVMSALGMLVSPLAFEIARTRRFAWADLDAATFESVLDELARSASVFLKQAAVDEKDIEFSFRLDMRYMGQGYEIEVELPQSADYERTLESLPELFARSYEKLFAVSYLREPIEILNWKVEARGRWPEMSSLSFTSPSTGATALKGTRRAYFDEAGGYIDCPVYDRYLLTPADRIVGPAIIEEAECTAVICSGDTVTIDFNGNLVADVDPAALGSVAAAA